MLWRCVNNLKLWRPHVDLHVTNVFGLMPLLNAFTPARHVLVGCKSGAKLYSFAAYSATSSATAPYCSCFRSSVYFGFLWIHTSGYLWIRYLKMQKASETTLRRTIRAPVHENIWVASPPSNEHLCPWHGPSGAYAVTAGWLPPTTADGLLHRSEPELTSRARPSGSLTEQKLSVDREWPWKIAMLNR